MVKTVVLVRHGKADGPERGLEDASRPLTAAGLRAIKAVYPKTFALLEGEDRHVWTSPYARAFQTAEVVSEAVADGSVEGHYSLALPNADDFLSELLTSDEETVVAVGHNPFMEEVAKTLLGYGLPFEKGSAAAIDLSLPEGLDPDSACVQDLQGDLLWCVKGPDWHRWKVLQHISEGIDDSTAEYARAFAAFAESENDTSTLDALIEHTDQLRGFISFVRPFAREQRVASLLKYLEYVLNNASVLRSYDLLCREIAARKYAQHPRGGAVLGSGLGKQQRPLTLEEELNAPDEQPTLYEHICQEREAAWKDMRELARSKKEAKHLRNFISQADQLKWRRRIEESGLSVDMIQRRYRNLTEGLIGEWNTVRFQDRKSVERLRLNMERIQVMGDTLAGVIRESEVMLPQQMMDAYPAIAELCDIRSMGRILARCDASMLYGEATYQMVLLNSRLDEREHKLIAQLEMARA